MIRKYMHWLESFISEWKVYSNSLGNGNIVHCWLSPFEILFDGQKIHELHGQVTLALHKLWSTCNYKKNIKCCYKRNMCI